MHCKKQKGRTRGRPWEAARHASPPTGLDVLHSARAMQDHDIQASWAFTFSTMLANAAGSWMAMSDKTLRSISIASFFKPAMNLL